MMDPVNDDHAPVLITRQIGTVHDLAPDADWVLRCYGTSSAPRSRALASRNL
jgi:hypothetical protein